LPACWSAGIIFGLDSFHASAGLRQSSFPVRAPASVHHDAGRSGISARCCSGSPRRSEKPHRQEEPTQEGHQRAHSTWRCGLCAALRNSATGFGAALWALVRSGQACVSVLVCGPQACVHVLAVIRITPNDMLRALVRSGQVGRLCETWPAHLVREVLVAVNIWRWLLAGALGTSLSSAPLQHDLHPHRLPTKAHAVCGGGTVLEQGGLGRLGAEHPAARESAAHGAGLGHKLSSHAAEVLTTAPISRGLQLARSRSENIRCIQFICLIALGTPAPFGEVPVFVHADEGQGCKKRSVWVISWSSALVHGPSLDNKWLYAAWGAAAQEKSMQQHVFASGSRS